MFLSRLLKILFLSAGINYVVEDEGGGSDTEETVGTQNDARLALLNQINDGLDESRAGEFDSPIDNDEAPVEDPPSTVLTTADDEDPAPEPAPRMFKIKVNGVEKELTQDELIARAQKVEAADTYLAEAARIKRQAEEQLQQKSVPSAEDRQAADVERRRELVRAIQMGTEDEAMAALDEITKLNAPTAPAVDIAKSIDERLSFKEAVNKFQTEYSDILSDPMLRDIALRKDQELLAQGDTRGYWERYEDIGNSLRTWKQSIAAPAPVPVDKQSRKSSAPKVPTVASTKSAAPKDEDEKEESTSDIIAGIAKARGGPQWMRS